jgi:hypothetical protein
MKPTALHIERWLDGVEARIVPPERKCLQIIIHELCEGESREKAFAELVARYPQNVAGKTVDDLNWSDDLVGAQEKAVAEHIAAHPEDAGRTVADFRWSIWEIVRRREVEIIEGDLAAKDTNEEAVASETPLLNGSGGSCAPSPGSDGSTDGLASPSCDTVASDLNVLPTPDNVLPLPDPGCFARSKPWRPVHQRPARDMRRPTWKKWER